MRFDIRELIEAAWDFDGSNKEFDETFCGIFDKPEDFVQEIYLPRTSEEVPDYGYTGIWQWLNNRMKFRARPVYSTGRVAIFKWR